MLGRVAGFQGQRRWGVGPRTGKGAVSVPAQYACPPSLDPRRDMRWGSGFLFANHWMSLGAVMLGAGVNRRSDIAKLGDLEAVTNGFGVSRDDAPAVGDADLG
jgi:hypothetical protein